MKQLDVVVTIDSQVIPTREVHTRHGVDQPVGTGSIIVDEAYRSQVELGDEVTIDAGWDGVTNRIFDGRVTNDEGAFSVSGGSLRIAIEGWERDLFFPQISPIGVGADLIENIVEDLIDTFSDLTPTVQPTGLDFGLDDDFNEVLTSIPVSTSVGAWLVRLGELFGFRLFGTGGHGLFWSRVNGDPMGWGSPPTPYATYTQGQNIRSITVANETDGLVNYWEIIGRKYTDENAIDRQIRSIPDAVPTNPFLGPNGISHRVVRDDLITSTTLASAARMAKERDFVDPWYRWRWSIKGDSLIRPGNLANVSAPDLYPISNPETIYVMTVQHTISRSGWQTDLEGWKGSDTTFSSGDNYDSQSLLGNGGVHLGNENLGYYRNASPLGTSTSFPLTIAEGYSSIYVHGWAHGSNAFNWGVTTTASRFEVMQNGEKVAGGDMPRTVETVQDYAGNDSLWEEVYIPLTGRISAGSATLFLYSGFDNAVSDYDDFEVRDLTLWTGGAAQPLLPGGGSGGANG